MIGSNIYFHPFVEFERFAVRNWEFNVRFGLPPELVRWLLVDGAGARSLWIAVVYQYLIWRHSKTMKKRLAY
ncbi:hypothetical protein [Mucilaginibacter defluvii]|uniref:hypothetical protein n=1 Tax=Mucilaginibacter defluvii TaxID=1196019 RepID=UPI0031EF921A